MIYGRLTVWTNFGLDRYQPKGHEKVACHVIRDYLGTCKGGGCGWKESRCK